MMLVVVVERAVGHVDPDLEEDVWMRHLGATRVRHRHGQQAHGQDGEEEPVERPRCSDKPTHSTHAVPPLVRSRGMTKTGTAILPSRPTHFSGRRERRYGRRRQGKAVGMRL
jgi:hypothetical protein